MPLASVGRLPRAVCLDLDLTPSGLGATAGIEVYANAPGEPADASRWPPLLDRLEDRELVRPAKRAALDTYPRVQVSTGLLDKLPLPYARAATLLAAQRTGRFIASPPRQGHALRRRTSHGEGLSRALA